jgi:hypothetical protein
VAQVGRERDFVNRCRANDAARRLTDEDFAHALKSVGAAFDMAVGFHASQKACPRQTALTMTARTRFGTPLAKVSLVPIR